MVSIEVKGIPELNRFLKQKSSEIFDAADKGIKTAGFFIQNEVVASITGNRAEPESVDTGAFRDSILAIFPKPLTAKIGSYKRPIPYADFLEYGTSSMKPRRHFRNTAKRNEKKVSDFVNTQIKKI